MIKLTAVRKPGRELLEAEIEALYRVRQTFWQLNPHADAAQEYAHFAAYVRRAQYTHLFRTAAGETVGGYIVEYEPRIHQGKRYIAFMPRFAYMHEQYRSNKLMPRSGIGTALRVRLRYPFTPIYLLSDALPPSYFVLANTGAGVWTLRDEDSKPSWEREVLADWARREQPLTMPEAVGLRVYNAVPAFADVAGQARLARHPHYAAYNRLNPRWVEGCLLFVMAPLRLRSLAARVVQRRPQL